MFFFIIFIQIYKENFVDKLTFYLLFCEKLYTVNLKIFASVVFSRNFACAKFRENTILTNCRNHSVVYLQYM